ncbi:hypothetical protein C4D60_Mb03t18290 [Musa balbisiana]|uniref:GST N-terminal domain-containing protein n=1 Tax=Musa balbisiana TaxID=52838 RepID=A0A4S8JAQ3_MUSBA|nr:hypothetical protein C4D60_Mb03t18290 [Musa balbisiana]
MLSVACGRPFYPLRSFHGQPNRLVVRRSTASIVERGSPCRPWRSYSSGSLPASSSSSRSRWNARPPGTDGDPAVESRVGSGSSGSPSTSFLSLLCPLLKFFGDFKEVVVLVFRILVRAFSVREGDPSQERNEFLEVATSSLSSLARSPWGSKSLNNINNLESATSPQTYLQIYEFEACPFCRRVREAMTELDLTVEVYPCPKGSLRHRELVRSIGGKEQFPFLVDLNSGVSMYESNDIVKYLFRQYGQGRNPSFGLLESSKEFGTSLRCSLDVTESCTVFTGWVPTLLRAGRGMTLWKNAGKEPSMKLELYSYENSVYSRIVREALCELELPYILHNVGEGSTKSKLLLETSGSNKVPYLIDPNTRLQMGDHKKILSYLFQTYSASS